MKWLTLTCLILSSLAFAGNHAEGQQQYLTKESTNYKAKYGCEMKWGLDVKKAQMTDNLQAKAFMKVFGEVEYPVRQACQKGGFNKFTEVMFVPGSVKADPEKCTPEQMKDSSTAKLNGKTLTISCKYINCSCADDSAEEATAKFL
jgi:hypothetical protein